MNDIPFVLGAAICTAVCAVSLKKYSPEISMLVAIGAGIIILVKAADGIGSVIETVNDFTSSAKINTEYVSILLKAVGIGILCQLVSDICRDSGQSSIASRVELACTAAIIINAMPMFIGILNAALGLISK